MKKGTNKRVSDGCMQQFIVFLRGINVGGNNLLPMKELVPLLAKNGFVDVFSYIQSGNIVLKSEHNPAAQIQDIVDKNYGFSPLVFALSQPEFSDCILNNPYIGFEGKFVHFYFCKNKISLAEEKVNKYAAGSEQFQVNGNVFYLHAPDGIGRSKLVTHIESCLGQQATGRNLNTIQNIHAMLNDK